MRREDLAVWTATEALKQAGSAPTPESRNYFEGAAEVMIGIADGLGVGAAIERQEAAGQAHLCKRDLLPVKAPWEKLEKLGFKKIGDSDGVLVEATLPEGWEKRPSDHSMWSYIHDEKGRCRASVFYKAAFYDRDAHLNLSRRFGCGTRPVGGYGSPNSHLMPRESYVTDCGADIWVSETKLAEPGPDADRETRLAHYDAEEALSKEAVAWLKERFPECDDPLAYWDAA